MAELSTKSRNSLSRAMFGLPAERKYPMPDKAHARNAKARASEEFRAGRLTRAEFHRINTMADRVLAS